MPLVRDCSCRGDSAGFAHLSCLTKYAEQKSKHNETYIVTFAAPWQKCNNCKQAFQNQLAIDLSSAFVSFAEATYGHPDSNKYDKLRVLESLRLKIMALSGMYTDKVVKVEMALLTNQLLTLVDQAKKDLNMSRWIHMPRASDEYQYYKVLRGKYEAFAFFQIGGIMLSGEKSEEGFNVMITHFKKACAIYNLLGMKDEATHLNSMISVHTAKKQAENDQHLSTNVAEELSPLLQNVKHTYEHHLNKLGANSEDTIQSGLQYAKILCHMYHCIEAERLVTKVATISRQVHGPHHQTTTDLVELREKCKERYVHVLPDDKVFQALRYENDEDICVVTGPITEPRRVDDERVYRVESNLIVPRVGCAVICNGLVSASHLNGELGEVRDVKKSGTGIRLAVYFETKGAKSALVKPENLRIAFELPSTPSSEL